MTSPRMLFAIAVLLGVSSFASATDIVAANFGGTFTKGGAGDIALAGATLLVGVPSGFPAGTLSFSLPAPATIVSGIETWTANALGSFTFSTTGLVFHGAFDCALHSCVYTPGANGFSVFGGDFSGLLTTISGTRGFTGSTTQVFLNAKGLVGGTTGATVPEIGTLGMVGMGLLGIAGFTKRKFSAAATKLRAL